MTVEDEIRAALDCASCSRWLRDALQSALARDCVDAANDADRLSNLLTKRCNQVLGNHRAAEFDKSV